MKAISGTNRAVVWWEAAQYLQGCPQGEEYNLILEILDPSSGDIRSREIEDRVDAFLDRHGGFGLNTIAETIFPAWEYRHHGVEGVYRIYPDETYPAIKRHPHIRWGTYAQRLLRRRDADGTSYNPLEQCVYKLKQELALPARFKARFELEVTDCIDLGVYDGSTDRRFRRGGPCLSHLSFKIGSGRRLYLTALYRYHCYVERALGNLLGLARLQAFVAEQADMEIGPLTCISTFAKLDYGPKWRKRDVASLLGTLEA
jgi:hypothetical protein